MWGFWILLLAVYLQDSSAITHREVTLMHSSVFKIRNLGLSDKLEFTAPDGVSTITLYTPNSTPKKGQVVTSGDSREFTINSVKFSDQGTFKVQNFWNSVTSSYALKVVAKRTSTNRVAGEALTISLEGLNKDDMSLRFKSGNDSLLLVKQGMVQDLNLPEYSGRLRVTSYDIRLLNFNVSDVGDYRLFDQQGRIVSVIAVNLVDRHEGINATPLLSLMLLGIPVGICCCCRKKICKCCYENKESNGVVLNTTTTVEHPLTPPGAPPAYNNPAAQTMYSASDGSTVHPPPNPITPQPPYTGPPAMNPAMNPAVNPGVNPAVPPNTNPMYPPIYPPAQPPQWNGAPYNAAPAAGFAPVMYSAPNASQPGPGPMQGSEIPATTPLLPSPQPEVAHPPALYSNVLNSSDSAFQYNPAMGKDSTTNFL